MDKPITVGILETGLPPEEFNNKYGSYPDMFAQLLQSQDASIECRFYAILEGDIPSDPHECDAWLITGSKFGVYEDHAWIKPVSELIRANYQANVPMIGICFGHQLIAQALGGKVIKSDKGWGLGVTQYPVTHTPDWMKGNEIDQFAIQAYHQDQVVELPKDATVLAATDFCPNAALIYGKQAISFQGHPEFSNEYMEALLQNRRGVTLAEEYADKALASVHNTLDTERLALWLVSFLKDALPAKA